MKNSSSKEKREGQRGIPHSKKDTAPTVLQRNINRARCLELRLQGLTYKQIAEETGLTESTAANYVCRSAKAVKDEVQERAALLVAIQDHRLEQGHERLQGIAEEETVEVKDVIAATEGQRKINESRRRLYGVDRPAKLHLSTEAATQYDLSKLTEEEQVAMLSLMEKSRINEDGEEPTE